ncbi:MAG TPA: cytochrome D1 domain-containing protein [Bacteroidota bacterium]|nr:cytochrome D1 domain-containing protein [Bacteroidota bacterium]
MTILIGLIFLLALAQETEAQTGTLVVLNKSDHTASLIALPRGETIAVLPTGHGPHEVAVSPNGKFALVCNYGTAQAPGHSLTMLDIPEKKKVKDIDLGNYKRPHGIAWMSGSNTVVVTVEANKAVVLVDVNEGKVLHAIETDQNVSHMVVVAPRNDRAFVANIGSGTMTALDLVGKKKIAEVETGPGAEGIDLTPDGGEVWVTNRAANTVSIIDALTLKIVATLESKDFPIRCKITPDGRYALVSNARSGEVAVFDVKERKEIRRIKMELDPVNETDKRLFGDQFGRSPVPIGILIHPGGTHAYVANSNADMVTVLDLRQWKVVGRIKTGKEPDGLGYSPLDVTR